MARGGKKICWLAALLCAASTGCAETVEQKKARLLAPATSFSSAEPFEAFQGGSGSNQTRFDANAFSLPSAALTFEQRADFFVGNGVFDRPWVEAPASTIGSDGLGPLYNARSCQGCHIKDGRGHPPEPDDTNLVSMVFGLSGPSGKPDPTFGKQLQDKAITGMASEGSVGVQYENQLFTYSDGTSVLLRRPAYQTDAALAKGVSLNPRIAPPMIGLGLIEAIDPADIRALEDPDDATGNGISGRAHILSNGDLGRFGWKATSATIRDQTAAAFSNDIGLSTGLLTNPWGDCTTHQRTCRDAPHGDVDGFTEVTDELLDLVVFYSANLAVPARRDFDDPDVLAGKQIFYDVGCASCHHPKFATSASAAPEQRNQLIWPYSDFLLHDLGPDLADTNPTGDIPPGEWRTAPLWGIGLTKTVNGHTYFLHDGRARSLEEAILWHGGEALTSRDAFAASPKTDRAALIRFLESL
ncbi:MAG: di-heme oxidoredictase family protein [Pseudomonadota bacterium]